MPRPLSAVSDGRIVSMDQFRGLVVVGMLIVNFLGEFAWFKSHLPILVHHKTYLSFADTIMPAFHFVVGFSLRLSFLRSVSRTGTQVTYLQILRRIGGLALIGIILELSENRRTDWAAQVSRSLWEHFLPLLKNGFWNTLTIIAITSLWVLPVIGRGVRTRIVFLCFNIIAHLTLCQYFYFHFMEGAPNPLSGFWGSDHPKGLDGGPCGFLAWSSLQILGSLSYDVLLSPNKRRACWIFLLSGVVLLSLGYALSCVSTLYPVTKRPAHLPATQTWLDEGQIAIAKSPVIPPLDATEDECPCLTLAPGPFIRPQVHEQRELNYWQSTKRVVTLPFQLETAGLSFITLSLLVLLCDCYRFTFGILRTFGQNPLATYIAHEIIGRAVISYAPHDAPLPWVIGSFILYFVLTYLFIRNLERKQIFLRM